MDVWHRLAVKRPKLKCVPLRRGLSLEPNLIVGSHHAHRNTYNPLYLRERSSRPARRPATRLYAVLNAGVTASAVR